jgi:MoxR-like ATPase
MTTTAVGAAIDQFRDRFQSITREIGKRIVGNDDIVSLTVTSLLAGGHVLLEGIPGVGKTSLVHTLADVLHLTFSRIQFTPDLMPADIVGTNIVQEHKQGGGAFFEFQPGPIFANVVLADEINRATPKTQSSLLEAMEEFQVSADGETRPLPRPFFVIATQNSVEHHGTFPLPESQLDRFVMRLSMGYPAPADEIAILSRQEAGHPIETVRAVISAAELEEVRRLIREVRVSEPVKEYLVDVVTSTRECPQLALGASPRATLDLLHSVQALAFARGRDHALPDDVKELADAVLAHRVILQPEARMRRVDAAAVVRDLLRQVPVPLAA